MSPDASSNASSNANGNGHSSAAHPTELGFSTRAIHVGSEPNEATGAVIPPISLSTTFAQDGVGNFKVSQQRLRNLRGTAVARARKQRWRNESLSSVLPTPTSGMQISRGSHPKHQRSKVIR